MTQTDLSAGDMIIARCGKCGDNTKHIILAISGQTPNRVRCDLCDREHVYRPPITTKPRKTSSTARKPAARRKVDPREEERRQWQEMDLENSPGEARPYAMDARFEPATRIAHPTFGMGVVVGLAGPNKMEVLFKDGKKILRCA